MIIGFTGSRHGMSTHQYEYIDELLKRCKPFAVHHGDCVGADEQFHELAVKYKCLTYIHPPSNNSLRANCDGDVYYEPKSYLQRNKDIVNICNILFATPLNDKPTRSGTWSTINYARSKKKPNIVFYRESGGIYKPHGHEVPECLKLLG